MSVTLPPKPDISGVNSKDQKAMLDYQQKMQEYWFAIQTLQSAQNREAEAESNMRKSADDAMRGIISNFK